MSKHMKSWVLIAGMTVFFTGPSRAAEEVPLAKDMMAVIALLGLPCGQVVNVKRQADNDHIATCQDGNRYRVFLNAEGRVVAQKQ